MPNFDGKGPLRRGRVIGRGRGPCGQNGRKDTDTDRCNEQEPENREPA